MLAAAETSVVPSIDEELFSAIKATYASLPEWQWHLVLPGTSSWLLPDGTIVPVDYHRIIRAVYEQLGVYPTHDDVVTDFESRGAVRLLIAGSEGSINIETLKYPTENQLNAVERIFEDLGYRYVSIDAGRVSEVTEFSGSYRWMLGILRKAFPAEAGFARLGTLIALGGAALVSKLLGWW